MVTMDERIEAELTHLREALASDVAAVAWLPDGRPQWAWWAASGCADDRYRMLSIRPGRGLEGSVLRVGRPLALDDSHPDAARKRQESALMNVERLLAAAACPIAAAGSPGVLMVGARSSRRYTADDLLVLRQAADRIGHWAEEAAAESGSGIQILPRN